MSDPVASLAKRPVPIRVVVVDDHIVFRTGSRGMLAGYGQIDVIAEATNGAEAVSVTTLLHPDVVLMDVHMPVMDGVTATRLIRKASPQTAVLAWTVSDTTDDAETMLDAGACGYILKDSGPNDLRRSIEDAHAGRSQVDRGVLGKMVVRLRAVSEMATANDSEPLTDRQSEVLSLLVQGQTNRGISASLGISDSTVKTHIREVYRRLGVDSRAGAAARGVALKLRRAG